MYRFILLLPLMGAPQGCPYFVEAEPPQRSQSSLQTTGDTREDREDAEPEDRPQREDRYEPPGD